MSEMKISGLEWARLNCVFVDKCVGKNETNCYDCSDIEDDAPKVDRGVPC